MSLVLLLRTDLPVGPVLFRQPLGIGNFGLATSRQPGSPFGYLADPGAQVAQNTPLPPSPPTPPAVVAEMLTDLLEPWMTDALALYIQAIGAMFDPVAQLAYPTGADGQAGFIPGWGTVFDPDLVPTEAIPYLGQYVGVTIPRNASEVQARVALAAESGLQRGTVAAIVAAVTKNLTGSQTVGIIERQQQSGAADAYWFIVAVRPEEVLSVTNLTTAVNAVKPGGVEWVLVQQDNWIWARAIHTWSADTMTWAQTAFQQP